MLGWRSNNNITNTTRAPNITIVNLLCSSMGSCTCECNLDGDSKCAFATIRSSSIAEVCCTPPKLPSFPLSSSATWSESEGRDDFGRGMRLVNSLRCHSACDIIRRWWSSASRSLKCSDITITACIVTVYFKIVFIRPRYKPHFD